MWFVAALLAFSVAYAALRYLRPAARQRGPLRAGLLAAAALTIAASSFAVWQLWPPTGDMYLNPRLGEWPQGAVLFALGVHAARPGGGRTSRRCWPGGSDGWPQRGWPP